MHELTTWLIRGSLLLLIGYLIARMLQTRSAAMAHRTLLVTLCTAAMLPLFAWGLPKWDLVKPHWASVQAKDVLEEPRAVQPAALTNPIDLPSKTDHAVDISIEEDRPAAAVFAEAELVDATNAIMPESSPRKSAQPSNIAATHPVSWVHWIAFGWFTGALLLAVRLLSGIAGLLRFVRRCDRANENLAQIVQESASKLNVRSRLRVVESPEGSMPMACWTGGWVIALPRDIETWDATLRQAAITHELGHIHRRDAWTDLLANLFSVAMWPHPLVWLIARNITRLRERACDEWVLQTSKLDEAGYANSLLTVIQRCQTGSLRIASEMATKKDFESRMQWLVSNSRPQKAKPLATMFAASIIIALSLVVASAKPVDPQTTTTATDETATNVILSEEPTPANPAISVTGTVVDNRTGEPIAGADVILRGKDVSSSFSAMPHSKDLLARTKTDANGKFAFAKIGVPPRMIKVLDKLRGAQGGAEIIALAPGMGMKWIELPTFQNEPQLIKLDAEANVAGVIVDQQGQPIKAASLFVRALYAGRTTLDSFSRGPGDLNLYSEFRVETFTDDKGKFRIANLPSDYRAMVWGHGPTGQRAYFLIDTGKNEFQEVKFSGGGGGSMKVHRTPIRISATQSPWIKIRVIDHDGKPVPSGGIEAVDQDRHYGGHAVVRSDGTAILIVNESGPHLIHYGPPPTSGLLREVLDEVNIQPERQETIEIRLPRRRFVSGKVVGADTLEPIVGAWVIGNAGVACSDAKGRFRLPVKSGLTNIAVSHSIDGYLVPSLFSRNNSVAPEIIKVNVPEDDSPIDDVTIKVSRGLLVKGVVVDSKGNPLPGVEVKAANQERPYKKASTTTDENGRFEMSGLSPFVPTRVSALTEFGAAETIIKGKEDQPWEETLAKAVALRIEQGTTLTGRVVHKGKPIAGVTMRLSKSPPRQPGQNRFRYSVHGETKTDKNGRYSISGLRKGELYEFKIIAPGDLQVRDWPHQSPYVQSIKVEDGETVELPDAELLSNGQTLRGIVVDPDGNPVPGITVSAGLKSGGNLSRPVRGPPPWTKSDKDGRFELTNLPEEPIVLMAYKANPAGGLIRNASKTAVDMNAKDIRIIQDPKLGTGIEDLD